MLVLTRKTEQSIIMDFRSFNLGLVEVVVCEVRGNTVRLGITADKAIPINRKEIHDEIERERERGRGDAS